MMQICTGCGEEKWVDRHDGVCGGCITQRRDDFFARLDQTDDPAEDGMDFFRSTQDD